MNGLSFNELCCLFCCPPFPGRIASKLAFLPPEPSYDLKADDAANSKFTLNLLDRADWQYGDREKECFEAFFARSSRGNRIACLFVKCSTNARYVKGNGMEGDVRLGREMTQRSTYEALCLLLRSEWSKSLFVFFFYLFVMITC